MKKKVLTLLMVLCMMLCLVPTVVHAEGGTTVSESDFTFDNTTGTITGFTNTSATDVVIPSTIGGVKVTVIGEKAFKNCTSLKSITIPDGVTTIGECAFQNCTNLKSITIPDSVTTIKRAAFYECTALKSITIPDDVITIEDNTFYHCVSLESITIPDGVTTIGDTAFDRCQGLKSIIIPDDVTTIEDSTFRDCTSLESIAIPDSVTTIGREAFKDCTSLESITIPDSVTTIKNKAFYGCTSLESITIPDSVTTIGYSAFSGCTSLESIMIPDSVTTIGNGVFSDCTSLTAINVDNGNTAYSSIDGVLFNKDCTKLLRCPSVKTGAYVIPDGVTTIEGYAFSNCTGLESITIPDSVTSIGEKVFYNCTSLENITIPDSVTSIGECAFQNCTNLKSITIPDSVTSIGKFAFSDCTSLESITIPNSVTSIESNAFHVCTGLKSITIPNNGIILKDNVFSSCNNVSNINFIGSETQGNSNAALNEVKYELNENGNSNYTINYIDVTYVSPDDLIYNGEPKEATVTKNDSSFGDITIKYYDKDGNRITGSPVDVGRYIVKIDISGNNTYSDIELGNFTIKQAPNSFTSELSIKDWTYGETPNSPSSAAKYGTPAYSYSTEKDGTYTETIPTSAGSYWVKAVVAGTDNYAGLEAKKQFNILAKQEAATTTPEVDTPKQEADTPKQEAVTPVTPPQIIDGKGQSVTAVEAKELSFRSDAAYKDFIRVEIDGKTLDEKNYTVREGSTIVTLKAEYVATLSSGDHTISIVSVNGVATTTFTVKEKPVTKSPQTGDDSHIYMWMALLVVSGGLLTAAGICVRKKSLKKNNN